MDDNLVKIQYDLDFLVNNSLLNAKTIRSQSALRQGIVCRRVFLLVKLFTYFIPQSFSAQKSSVGDSTFRICESSKMFCASEEGRIAKTSDSIIYYSVHVI